MAPAHSRESAAAHWTPNDQRGVDIHLASIGMIKETFGDTPLVSVDIALNASHCRALDHVVKMKGRVLTASVFRALPVFSPLTALRRINAVQSNALAMMRSEDGDFSMSLYVALSLTAA